MTAISKPLVFIKYNHLKVMIGQSVPTTFEHLLKYFERQIGSDYLVVLLPSPDVVDFEFQVFRTEDSAELDIEKLKKQVLEYLTSGSTQFDIKQPTT